MFFVNLSTERLVKAVLMLYGIAFAFFIYHREKLFRNTSRDEDVSPDLQRQLNIARRNAIAHSLKPAHEKLPARMRVRLMNAKKTKGQAGEEVVDRSSVARKGKKRVRFVGDEEVSEKMKSKKRDEDLIFF